VLWLAADKGVTTSGSKVTKWADQSGNANHGTATSGDEPTLVAKYTALGGQPALQFSSSSSNGT
jgi:tetraacyldisaccharide-1-P 4'-kinase